MKSKKLQTWVKPEIEKMLDEIARKLDRESHLVVKRSEAVAICIARQYELMFSNEQSNQIDIANTNNFA